MRYSRTGDRYTPCWKSILRNGFPADNSQKTDAIHRFYLIAKKEGISLTIRLQISYLIIYNTLSSSSRKSSSNQIHFELFSSLYLPRTNILFNIKSALPFTMLLNVTFICQLLKSIKRRGTSYTRTVCKHIRCSKLT